MINTFALHPAASKSLIARAVCQLPEVKQAWQNGKIFIGHGSTNVAVAQELLNIKIEHPEQYISGVISQGVACATEPQGRLKPWCIERGRVLDVDWIEFVNTFEAGDIFIKGANAIDPGGNVGILDVPLLWQIPFHGSLQSWSFLPGPDFSLPPAPLQPFPDPVKRWARQRA
jgi:hypothetical protein